MIEYILVADRLQDNCHIDDAKVAETHVLTFRDKRSDLHAEHNSDELVEIINAKILEKIQTSGWKSGYYHFKIKRQDLNQDLCRGRLYMSGQ